MRLIKKDSLTEKCDSSRLNEVFANQTLIGCLNKKEWDRKFITPEFLYNDKYNWINRGIFRDYDNSGIAFDIKLNSSFVEDMDQLITNNWINNRTYFLTCFINFYSRNLNRLFIVKNTYELNNYNFLLNTDIKISYIENIENDGWFFLAIIMSVLYLISEFFQLKKIKDDKKDYNLELNFFQKILNYFSSNFYRPSLFFIISKYFFKNNLSVKDIYYN
jgi:hypothetical protein